MASIASGWVSSLPQLTICRPPRSFSLSNSQSRINPKNSSSSAANPLSRIQCIPKFSGKRAMFIGNSSNFNMETSLLGSQIQAQKEDYYGGQEATEQEEFSWSSVILPFLFPALGGLLFGYDIGATSGATISLQSPELSGITWFNLSAIQLGLVVSGSLYGALFGSILVYPVADFLGRRRELIIAAILYALGGFVTARAPSLEVLLLGRFLYGLGIGWAMHGAPLYIAETCPSQIRGTLVSLKELFIVLGILLGYFVGSYQVDAVGGWRYMFGMSVPVALLMGLGVWSLPPSPRWLLLRAVQGKDSLQEYKQQAIAALSRLRGRPPGDKVSESQIDETLVSLKSAYSDEQSEGSLLEITGQPSVLYYAGSILQSAGFSAASDATRVSVLIGLFKLLMTGIAVFKVDDIGRKPLLIGGVSGIVCPVLVPPICLLQVSRRTTFCRCSCPASICRKLSRAAWSREPFPHLWSYRFAVPPVRVGSGSGNKRLKS
ncbi:hypothetical protein Cgig2_003919 [Carnegiea gigantea]|uniref:Major facilitator superfamily (MFS) profile domain-containing protein n=1 Tax=Carnegiea gigantea TaxID=171969 RepID=A0A9Q1KAL9_9CARY|nr:hypothetical protein Cgig2_003919 [Carnegiea gigantea]